MRGEGVVGEARAGWLVGWLVQVEAGPGEGLRKGRYSGVMLRTALRPRWLGLLLVVLLAATGMAWLGQWQLNRARIHARGPALRAERAQETATPKPLESVLKPQQTFLKNVVNTRVTVSGQWDGARRLLVTGRTLDGRSGYWVLVPLRMSDGAAVAVVRGWVATPTDPAASSMATQGAGTTQVVGMLEPTEPPEQLAPGQGSGLPADQLQRVSAADLVNRWPYPLVTGFVVEQSQTPSSAATPALVPPPSVDGGLDLQNVSYAIQWWIFAGLGVFLWYRLVRDDYRGDLRPADGEGEDAGGPGNPDSGTPGSGAPGSDGSGAGVAGAGRPLESYLDDEIPDDLSRL